MPRPSKFTVLKLARPGGRSLFRIVIPARFTAEGKRKAVYYQTAAAAEADARTLRAMHTQGTIGLLSLLTPEQVKDARAALDALHAAGLNLTLTEAAAVAARHSKAVRGGVSVAELLARYEQEAGTSRAWRPSTRTSWRRFARPMTEALGSTPCAELTTAALLDWLRAAFPSAQAFNGAHRTLAGAFVWAVKQRLAEENPFARIDKISTQRDDVDVFTPAEARAFLAACRDLRQEYQGRFALDCTDCRPAVAVLLFAGARPAELARLTWKDLHPQADGTLLLFIHGKNAKTKTARFIRVRPNLRAFLESVPPAARTGKIIPPDWPRKIQAVRAAAGLAGRADTARHSFASYALAAGEPLHDVMADMGHVQASTVIFTHYRAAATPAAAKAYWAIRP